MRILHTIDSIGIYGAETVLLNLCTEQQRRGWMPIIFSIGNTHSDEKPIEAIARLRGLPCIRHRMRDGLNLYGARQILATARRERVDVIHSHGYKSNILLAALPRFMHICPVVATLHGWTAQRALSRLGLYRFLDQRLLPRLDAIVIVNEGLKHARSIVTLDPRKVHWIPNGISMDCPSNRLAIDLAADPLAQKILELKRNSDILIGAVGRLSPEKNFGALIDALPRAVVGKQRVGAVLLGDGTQAASIAAGAARHGILSQVLLGGYCANARQYLQLFDTLVIPSLTEGLPMILLEAMAEGLPVIATRVGDVPVVLKDDGILVEPGDVGALAHAIQVMMLDPSRFRERAHSAGERIRREYSASTMASRYDEVYLWACANQAVAHEL